MDSSDNHLLILGLLVFFYEKVITLFAINTLKSTNIRWFFLSFKLSGCKPNINSCGIKGTWICKIFWVHCFTSCQNFCISVHCQVQWKKVPFSFSHLIQISGIALLYLFSFSGVIYVCINQLYCSNFRQVSGVFDCALVLIHNL